MFTDCTMFEISCTYLQEIVVPRLSFIQGAPHLVQKKKGLLQNVHFQKQYTDSNGLWRQQQQNSLRKPECDIIKSCSEWLHLLYYINISCGQQPTITAAFTGVRSWQAPASECGDFNKPSHFKWWFSYMLQPMFSLSCVRAQLFSDPLATLFSKESR